jgi:hypothetical protein
MIYNLAIILALIHDKVDSFFELPLLKVLTLGKWVHIDSKEDRPNGSSKGEDGKRYLTTVEIVCRAMIGIIVAYLLIGGYAYRVMAKVINIITSI